MKTPQQIARKAAEEIDVALGTVNGRENLIQAMTAIIKSVVDEAYDQGSKDADLVHYGAAQASEQGALK
jgi:hypothetical protein